MKNIIKHLVWDSDFFKMKVGELIIKDMSIRINDNNLWSYDLIYVITNTTKDINIVGFKKEYYEAKVVFTKELTLKKRETYTNITNFNDFKQIEKLYELAYESGKMSRFKLDNTFSDKQFKSLYRKWVDNSLNKSIADDVLVYYSENTISGFVTYSFKGNEAKIGLIGVDSKYQGQGIGSKLIDTVEDLLLKRKIKTLHIPTQLDNKQACDFYKKLNFKITNNQIINHYWKI